MSQWILWWDGGVGVLTGEAASPEHVLSDAFRVTHFEGTEIGQWLGNERKQRNTK